MVIALLTWGDLRLHSSVFGFWYVVGIHSENAPWGRMRTPQWSAVQTQEYFWQLLDWSSSSLLPFTGDGKERFHWYYIAGSIPLF